MTEPVLFGLPISLLFFYFFVYSFLGWCMETAYCSILERRFVPRGFLYGPICPIYGVGVLMMICWFRPLMGRPLVFYITAVVCMSAWEYFVGWFLETTTHIKYWDYSSFKCNLKGRICLWVSLMWGLLSYVILYFVHPHIEGPVLMIPAAIRYFVDGIFAGVLLSDAAATIYQLAKTTQLMEKVQRAGDELRVQAALGKAELADRLDDLLPDQLDEAGRALKSRYDALMAAAERQSRRFRAHYAHMTSKSLSKAIDGVRRVGAKVLLKTKEEKAKKRR